MADKETGLNIPVSAVADKNSAKEAVNELTKDVLSSLKDGYIEIPAELKVPIKGASKDLEKAQKDVIKQWERTFREGFSSSAKDLDALTEAYQRFKKLAGQQHKAGTKQSKGISAIMGEQIQVYNTTRKSTQVKTQVKKSKVSSEKKLLKEEIDNAIAQDYKRKGYTKFGKELARGSNRAKASTPGSPINLGLRTPSMGGPYIDEKTLRMSEISPYRNMDEVRRAKELQEIKAKERASTKIWKDQNYKVGGKDNKIGTRGSDRSQSGTEYELIKKALLTEMAKLQGGLVHGRPDATSQKLIDQVLTTLAYDEQQGTDPLKSVMGIHNMLQKRYDTAGKIGATDGSTKGEGANQKEANETLSQIYKILSTFIEARKSIVENVLAIKSALTDKSTTKESLYSQEVSRIQASSQMKSVQEALKPLVDTTSNMAMQNIRESSRKTMADQAEARTSRSNATIMADTLTTVKDDANTGFNTERRATDLIEAVQQDQDDITLLEQIRDLLQQVVSGGNGGNKGGKTNQEVIRSLPDLFRSFVDGKWTTAGVVDKTDYTKRRIQLPGQDQWDKAYTKQKNTINDPSVVAEIERELEQINAGVHESQQRTFVDKSQITTSQKGLMGALRKIFKPETEVDRIMSANAEEQARMRAERIETYGLNRGRNLTDTGDIADIKRTKALYGWFNKNNKNSQLFQDIKLTPGFTGENKIDTSSIMKSLNKVLSGPEMFKAQTGGTLRNIIGSMTGYIGMPSLEKSRAQAEGLNQVMSDVRNEVLGLIQDIQVKEATLTGMQEKGTARFDKEGRITDDSSLEAKTTFTKLEEQKGVLKSALAEVGMIDQVVSKTGGKISKIIKNLGFVMPELMKNNTIIQNLNAGLDKNGKALKFQTRLAETLNYSFQLMSRHIGQMVKNWMMQLNPLTQIKKLFQDFSSYDVKWQRTMNVIKYNLRRIVRPMMEWIAQQLVNIIGLLNAVIKGIGAAFGKDWDLFDQSAANAEKMREELEAAANVTAGFDELHDIGSDNSAANDLMGDIYKPEWTKLYEGITEKVKSLVDKLKPIFEGLGKVLKWCIDNWKLLVGLWAAFKIAQGLWNLWKFFSGLGELMGGLPAIFLKAMSAIAGVALITFSQIGTVKLAKEWDQMSKSDRWKRAGINIGEGIAGGALVGFAIGGPMGAAIGAGIGAVVTGFEQLSIAAYNGSEAATVAAGALGAAGLGGAIGFLVGGPVGAAVGAIGGALVGALAGAAVNAVRCKGEFNKLKISAEDLAWAQQQTADATQNYYGQLSNLEQLEAQTGESGEALYNAIADGSLAVDKMTSSQYAVYEAYKNTKVALEQLQAAQKTELEYSARMALDADKEADNFQSYISTIQKGMEQGVISHAEMVDNFAQGYAELSKEQRKVFLEELPPYMRQSVEEQSEQYLSGWEKFKKNTSKAFKGFGDRISGEFKTVTNSIADGWKSSGLFGAVEGFFTGMDKSAAKSINSLYNLKATQEDLQKSTEDLAKAQQAQNELQAQVDQLQQQTGISASTLYEELMNGSKVYTLLTDDEKLLIDKYTELQSAMETTDTCAAKHVETMASIDLQAAQTSGNYDTFINNLIAANERGEIDTQTMQSLLSQAYANLDYDARKTFMEQIPENMRQGVEDGASQYEGRFQKMGNWLRDCWEGIKQNASEKWQEIKDSAIGQKVQEIWQNVTNKFNDIKNSAAEKWRNIKDDVGTWWKDISDGISGWAKSAWENASSWFSNIVDDAKDAWEKVKGYFSNIGDAWNQGDNVFEKVGNSAKAIFGKKFKVASMDVGTNYVPNDGLAYLHQGEAVIPKKYNQPYQPTSMSAEEKAYMSQMVNTMRSLDDTIKQGISVKGEFKQRGSDLVATVEKIKNRNGNRPLNNSVFAR